MRAPVAIQRGLFALAAVLMLVSTSVAIRPAAAVEETGVVFGRRPATAPAEVEGSVIRLYQAAFNRTFDVDGLNYWMWIYAQGYSLPRIASFFSASDEYREFYAGVDSHEQFVRTVYRNVLGREGETSGVEYWTGLLNTGRWPRHEILMYISESVENQVRTSTPPPAQPRKWIANELDEARFVRLYIAAFGQAPSHATSDLYTRQFRTGQALRTVASNLMASPEFQEKFNSMSDARYAAFVHEHSLGFRITEEWANHWSTQMAGMSSPRLDLLVMLSESADLVSRTRTPVQPGNARFASASVVLTPVTTTTTSPTTTPTTTTTTTSPTTTTTTTTPPAIGGLPIPADAKVLVVGDSLMLQMQTYAQNLGSHPTHYQSVSGGSILQIPGQVQTGLSANGPYAAVIIHTGTNGWQGGVIDQTIADFAPTPVLLVNMFFDRDKAPASHPQRPWYDNPNGDTTNNGLQALADANSHVQIIDWHAAATANPNWIAGDGLHMNGSNFPPALGVAGMEALFLSHLD